MAKDTKPADIGDAPPKKSKKLLIIIGAVVLVLVILAAAAIFLLKQGHADEDEGDDEVAEETVKKPAKKNKGAPPVFVNLDTFTVNLAPENGEQYLQVIISVELESAESQAQFTAMMPRIRNNVTLLLSSKKASELQPKEGKEKLAREIADAINSAISPPLRNKRGEMVPPDGPVVSVLFTSFIIQ